MSTRDMPRATDTELEDNDELEEFVNGVTRRE